MAQIDKIITLFTLILLLSFPVLAQEHSHSDSAKEETSVVVEEGLPEAEEIPATENSTFASWDEFPNLHPMVVHFPIVLLLVALLSQFIGLFAYRKEMSWVTIFLLTGGFIGALLAGLVFHPHTSELPENVKQVFETHEYYAFLTIWLAAIALVLKIISHFTNRKTWFEVIVFLVLGASALTVSLAGHLGSQMVFIEEVGAGGNYIEQHDK
ncbi:hypothetical protein GM418_19630 [Maribellus comscasis]|uniref:DUF2231 domain-containing protein n=1 Tax=Maribellus comscasis TaxID=2681766 RepID=A0A6I6K2Q0_9BACT|nr:DUF2231 domain-containing protein [Maribellus comscasis]QGY45803.1 hypothetical protein GM418_19630 [Maribellus comscasis]